MKSAAFSLVVLTLNVAGPRRAHQGWPTRREAIVSAVAVETPGVAAFQEVWRGEDLFALAAAAGHKRSVRDAELGLAITSRGEIESSDAAGFGGGAGALLARVKAGRSGLDVYSVQLERGEGPAASRRLAQLFELAEFVRSKSSGRPFIVLGDLGAPADDKDAALFLDLVEGRDLCVPHGDDLCARAGDERRQDFAVIPYASRQPRERARPFLTHPLLNEDDEPVPMRPGLRARLDSSILRLKPAAEPEGRAEALAAIADALGRARLAAEDAARSAGWLPFLGTADQLRARAEIARLAFSLEEVRSAQIRAARAAAE